MSFILCGKNSAIKIVFLIIFELQFALLLLSPPNMWVLLLLQIKFAQFVYLIFAIKWVEKHSLVQTLLAEFIWWESFITPSLD